AYILQYSERKNTIAARKFLDDVPENTKADRVARLIELQREISLKKNRALIGRSVEVLVEGEGRRPGQWRARTDGNIVTIFPKRGLAPFRESEHLRATALTEKVPDPLSSHPALT